MDLAVVEVNGLKRMREDAEVVISHDGDVGEVDEGEAPANKRQGRIETSDPQPSASVVLDVTVPRGGSSTSTDECVSAVTGVGGEEEGGPTAAAAGSTVLSKLEECLVADEQVGSSESAVSEENAARVLRSLEEELGLSASEDHTAVSSTPSPAPPCAEAFAGWADDVWNIHGFSSADLSVGCSSGSSLTGDDVAVCERFDILPLLNQGPSNVPVDMCFPIPGSKDEFEGASSADAENAGFDHDVGKQNDNTPMIAAGGPAIGTLESLQNSVIWALEEGFDDYSGFSDMAVGDEWMTPVDNLDFLLDSTSAYATVSPFVEEGRNSL